MFLVFLWAAASLVACSQATGTFAVLHTPENLVFKGKDKIDQSLLKDVYTAALGYTAKSKPWTGMYYKIPFKLPEAVVAVAVEGIDTLGMIEGKKFALNVDELEEFTWQALSGRIQNRDNDNCKNCLVRIYLGDGLDALGQSALGELKPNSTDEFHLKALSLKNTEDRKFLEELQLLHAIADKVRTVVVADGKPDVYWLVVSGLKPVFDVHGKNSVAAKEALTLLDETLRVVSKAFRHVYKDQVLITAFTNDASQVRHIRSTNLREKRAADEKTKEEEPISNKMENTSGAPNRGHEEENTEEKDEKNNKKREKNHSKQTMDRNEDKEHKNLNEHSDISTQTENTLFSTEETDFNEHYNFTYYSNESESHNENLAPKYSDDYPIIFNIILWFMIIFFFSLLAICIVIAEMDPGRDSIIYRMTSNRMKKDN